MALRKCSRCWSSISADPRAAKGQVFFYFLAAIGMQREQRARTVVQSFYEYGRGLAGGLLFSMPLLYTMEVWWVGHSSSPERLIAALAATFVLLLGYNRYAGLHPDASWAEVVIDSVEELGLGLLVSAGVMWLLGRVTMEMSLSEIVGKILMESITVAVGVSVGTAQLGGETRKEEAVPDEDEGGFWDDQPPHKIDLVRHAMLSFCGAVLIAGNIAPTEEIVMIASEVGPGRLAGIAIVSLVCCALVMYFSEFIGSGVHPYSKIDAVFGVCFTYVAALTASALLLLLFDSFSELPIRMQLAQTVVLGLPASLGASAGRLLLQQ